MQSVQALVSYLQDEEAGNSWIVVVLQLVILLLSEAIKDKWARESA